MTYAEWLKLMQFPVEWQEWGLLPSELQAEQLARYEPGHESAPEHDRHGAFQWWLRGNPGPEVLAKLARLSWLDPDPTMAAYVRESIARHTQCSQAVLDLLAIPYARFGQ